MTDIDQQARTLAAKIGVRYSAGEKCNPGTEFYAFTPNELQRPAADQAEVAA